MNSPSIATHPLTRAIIEVLEKEGKPLEVKVIKQKITTGKGLCCSKNAVNSYLFRGTKEGLFENISYGVYALAGTTVSVPHSHKVAAGKVVGRSAPVVVRLSTSYDPSDPKYKTVSDITDFQDLTQQESKLLELIVNFRLKGEVCFADILDKVEVEFSDKAEPRPQSIDAAHLRKKLNELREERAKLQTKIQKLCKKGGPKLEEMAALSKAMDLVANEAEKLLANYGDKVVVNRQLLGEFVSENHPKPKIVIYYKNIENFCERERIHGDNRNVMAGVFVHEMFHAWNYFQSGERARSVLAIDEPMVEFGTLYFLKELELQSHVLKGEVSCVSLNREGIVQDKRKSIGDVAAYGFGYYLFKNLSDADSINWIETYSEKSASINDSDEPVKNSESALIPLYPFTSEKKVMEWFREIIFEGYAIPASTGKSAAAKAGLPVSLRALLLACIETIGRKCFSLQDLYAFAPIFKVCVPQCMNLEDELKQQLEELVKEGILEALPHDCYSME